MFTISSKLLRRLGPALLLAGAMLGLLVTGPELAAQRTSGASQYIRDFYKASLLKAGV
jgi:hypothetical protein